MKILKYHFMQVKFAIESIKLPLLCDKYANTLSLTHSCLSYSHKVALLLRSKRELWQKC